jgi:hypothetical protein
MKNLYIIGNGFDLYHKLDTKYQSFAKYLAEKDSEVYELFLTYYGLPDISEDPVTDEEYAAWATFELALADLDYEQVLEDHSDSAANPGAEDFRDRDWHTYQVEMEMIIEKLTKELIADFNNFILNVKYPSNIDDKKISIVPQSLFLNFNYTETIEKYYKISDKDICYIHNKAIKTDSKIILGHGTDPSNFVEKEPEPPENLSEEELEQWNDSMADQYEYSYSSAKSEILSYYTKAFKNTEIIISQNADFFNKLSTVEKVYVLGHSISEVDIKYFEKVLNMVKKDTKWVVTYYSDYEKQKHFETLTRLGIETKNLTQLKMEDLK